MLDQKKSQDRLSKKLKKLYTSMTCKILELKFMLKTRPS